MKYFKGLFLFLLILCSCNSFEEKEVKNEIHSTAFDDFQSQNNLKIIDLDSFVNFSELRKVMSEIACNEKVSGLKFNYKQINYYLTGYSSCPKSNEIACYFTPNILTIKNDSLIASFDRQKNKSIEYLKTKLDIIVSKKYNIKTYEDKLKPAIIHLYIEDKYPISKTKKVLKEIVEQFKQINLANNPHYFKYTILFEGFSISDLPPPPPPPKASNE